MKNIRQKIIGSTVVIMKFLTQQITSDVHDSKIQELRFFFF